MEGNEVAVWVVGFGEDDVLDVAGQDIQGYIDGGRIGAHGDALHGGGKSDVAEVEVYRGCHAAKVRCPDWR